MTHDYDELSLWYDIVEEAMNGRDENLKCPCDKAQPVEAEVDEHMVRVQCTECGKFVEAVRPY